MSSRTIVLVRSEDVLTSCLHSFCDQHTPADSEDAARWLIIRDVLHALLVPIVELFDKAASVAEQATVAQHAEDLEYAFTGEARSAFVWLTCFLDEERNWCYTQGCPACVVDHALDSEFTIRLLCTACLLSDVHYPFTLEGPTLPSFMFFLDSLQLALEQDDLYGPDYFYLTTPKARTSRNGIEELIRQSLELDAMLSAPSSSTTSEAGSAPTSPVLAPLGGKPRMKVKRSKMAKRQMKLKIEEEQWMESILENCRAELQPAVKSRLLPVRTQKQDAAVKTVPTVAISEVVDEG